MGEEHSVNRGFLVLSIAGILTKITSVFYIPVLQRIIGLDGYGIYQNCYEVFLFAYAITNLGTQPAIAKVVAELTALDKPDDAVRTLEISRSIMALVGGILSILLMLFAFPIGNLIKNPAASYGIMALAPSIFITSILSAYRGYFQGRSSMTAIAVSQVVEQIINIVVSLLCAYLLYTISVEYGSAGGTIGTSVGAIVACIYMLYVYRKKNYAEEAFEAQEHKKRVSTKSIIRKLIKYGLPITLSAGLQNFGSLVDMVNVNARLAVAGFDMQQSQILYGVLGRYKTLLSVPLIIVTALATTVLPAISGAVAVKDKKEIRRRTSFAFRIVFVITIPAAAGLSILSSEVFELLYGTTQGYELMMYGSVVLILQSIVQIQTVILQSMNKLYYVLGTFLIGIAAKIIANYILVAIPGVNILGVVVGNFLWFAIPAVLNQRALRKSLRVKIPLIRNIVKPLIASIAMVVLVIVMKEPINIINIIINAGKAVRGITTFIMICAGGFLYLYVIIITGGLRRRDIESISPRIYRMLPKFLRKKIK